MLLLIDDLFRHETLLALVTTLERDSGVVVLASSRPGEARELPPHQMEMPSVLSELGPVSEKELRRALQRYDISADDDLVRARSPATGKGGQIFSSYSRSS